MASRLVEVMPSAICKIVICGKHYHWKKNVKGLNELQSYLRRLIPRNGHEVVKVYSRWFALYVPIRRRKNWITLRNMEVPRGEDEMTSWKKKQLGRIDLGVFISSTTTPRTLEKITSLRITIQEASTRLKIQTGQLHRCQTTRMVIYMLNIILDKKLQSSLYFRCKRRCILQYNGRKEDKLLRLKHWMSMNSFKEKSTLYRKWCFQIGDQRNP